MLPVAEPSYHRPTTRPSRRTHLHHFPTCRPSRSESKTLCHLALSSSAILLPNLPSCTDHDTYVCRERERKRRYYIRASHFTPISGRGRFCPTCAGPPPSVVRSTRPDFEHHLGLQLATSSCMVSRSTWTTRATKPRHLQLADLRRIRSIRPPAPRNPAFGRVEGENGLAESPKRASEMSEGARGALPHSERAALDAGTLWPRPSPRSGRPGGQCRADRLRPHGSASCR